MGLIDTAMLSRFWQRVKEALGGSASSDLANVSGSAFAQKITESVTDGIYTAESQDGVAYTATIPGITELKHGMRITVSPSRVSASTAPTLDVNGLGAKGIRLPLSFNNVAVSMPKLATFFSAGKPILLMYDGTYVHGIWKAIEKPKVSAQDLYGLVPIDSGGTGAETADEALENLGAVSRTEFDTAIAAINARLSSLEGS